MDSAHKHLVIVLLENGNIRSSFESECWKRQSETLFPALITCCEQAGWQSEDIDEIVITEGPGSYTGVRIAMSVAKVFAATMNKPLYCISTLQLYAGKRKHAFVMLDARSSRAYCAHYHEGALVKEEKILTLDEIRQELQTYPYDVCGDCDLIGLKRKSDSLAENFCAVLPFARKVENIHTLTPRYLKDAEAYKVKK